MNKIARVGDAASFRSSEVNDVQFTVQPIMCYNRETCIIGSKSGEQSGEHEDVSVTSER